MKFSIIIFLTILVATAQAENWNCRNDLEITCFSGKCEVRIDNSFTPMDVNVDDSGSMSVCAYTGCWEGTGEVLKSGDFTVITGTDLQFSTAQNSESMNESIVIVIDTHDNVAILKAGAFAHPLICKKFNGVE